jgi:hypothetical protein
VCYPSQAKPQPPYFYASEEYSHGGKIAEKTKKWLKGGFEMIPSSEEICLHYQQYIDQTHLYMSALLR